MTSRGRTFPVDDAGELLVNIDKLIDTRFLLQANSGGGKGFAARRFLEQTHGRAQQIVIDPEGEFASLREKFDYVLAAPSGGDTVAHPRSAGLLAERLLELGVSAIIDLFELPPRDRVLFVRRFLEALINVPKRLWHPAIILVDEAHRFAPEKGHGEAESLDAVINLASLGRKRGFCAVLATQRIAKLNKDAAADLNNKLIGRVALDIDVKRAAAELGFGKERYRELIELEPGHFFATGPAFSARGITRVHVGGVQTTHPKAGARIARKPPPATSTIRALLPKLADLPAEAEDRARSLDEMRANVKRLERELAAAKKAQPPAPKPAAPPPPPGPRREDLATIRTLRKGLEQAMKIIVQITAEDFLKADGVDAGELQKALDVARQRISALLERKLDERTRAVDRVKREAVGVLSSLQKLLDADVAVDVTVARVAPTPASVVVKDDARSRPTSPAPPREPRDPGGLPRGETAVLTAIAQHGDVGVTREQLTILTGYKRSTRDLYLQKLRAAGLVHEVGNRGVLTATADGVAALGDNFDPLPTGDELREHWLAKLPAGERAVLEAAIGVYPGEVSRDQLSETTGYKRSTRDLYVQKLAARKLVTATRTGIRADDLLFDGGRR